MTRAAIRPANRASDDVSHSALARLPPERIDDTDMEVAGEFLGALALTCPGPDMPPGAWPHRRDVYRDAGRRTRRPGRALITRVDVA